MKINYERLKENIVSLPGWNAQNLMAPLVNDTYRKLTENYKSAGVMALFYKENDEDQIVIIERSRFNPNDKHAGQLSFPGGKYEDSDGELLACALREVEEEIGVKKEQITVVGPLTELFVFASNFLVFPFVGYLEHKPTYTIQESEVHAVHTLSVAQLLDPATKKTKNLKVSRGVTLPNVPYYDLDGKVLWGATAMIMSELEAILKKSLGA